MVQGDFFVTNSAHFRLDNHAVGQSTLTAIAGLFWETVSCTKLCSLPV